jgi:hypothetical protein
MDKNQFPPNVVSAAVTLFTRIRQVFGSNLGQDIDNPDRDSS